MLQTQTVSTECLELLKNISASEFFSDFVLVGGTALALQIGHIISFTLPSEQEIPGKIQHIGTDSVQVDFNHPLAGHNLRFELEIIELLD